MSNKLSESSQSHNNALLQTPPVRTMTLPSFHNLPLSVNAPNGSASSGNVHKVPNVRERLADIPPELWDRIRYYLGDDRNLDSLVTILQWCKTNSTNWKACDEKWYKH
eukprot:929052-Prymnesium_polylepis.1